MYIPEDLQEAFSADSAVENAFNALSDKQKYLHIKLVTEVADPQTRVQRIKEVLSLLATDK